MRLFYPVASNLSGTRLLALYCLVTVCLGPFGLVINAGVNASYARTAQGIFAFFPPPATMAQWHSMLGFLFFAKMLLTTLNRGVYPFADYFASELNVSRESFFFVLSAGEFTGFLAPVFGEWADVGVVLATACLLSDSSTTDRHCFLRNIPHFAVACPPRWRRRFVTGSWEHA